VAGEIKTIKSLCNRCGLKTNHYERFNHTVSETSPYDSEYSVEWVSTYTFLECCGCSDVSIRQLDWCSEWDRGDYHETFFPPRASRRKPSYFESLSEEYQSLLGEIYTALQADSRQLAMMGARAVIDLFILRKVGDQGDFAKGMVKLEEDGYIGRLDKDIINAAIDAGHAASHRAHIPSSKELTAVMDIIENLLQHDLLAASAETLRKHTPARTPRAASKKETP
jgi:hypothetical protein